MIYTNQDLKNIYKKLPEKVRVAIASEEISDSVNKIAKNNNLNADQRNIIGEIVGDILLGIESKNELSDDIKESLYLDQKAAGKISMEVITEIIDNIDSIYEKTQQAVLEESPDLKNKSSEQNSINLSDSASDQIKWKVDDIAIKYSLSKDQSDLLIKNVFLFLNKNTNKKTFQENLLEELDISRFLSEQITEDLEIKVFEYASKESSVNKSTLNNIKIEPENISRVPEVKPNNLPTQTDPPKQQVVTPTPPKPPVQSPPKLNPFPKPSFLTTQNKPLSTPVKPEAIPEVKNIVPEKSFISPEAALPKLTPIPSYKPTSQVEEVVKKEQALEVEDETGAGRITYTSKTLEPVQQPIAVPRFTATAIPEDKIESKTESEPVKKVEQAINMMDNKLTKVTTGMSETKPIKSYTIDPYREPLE